MALQSQLFHGDKKLEAAAVSDPDHIMQGSRGDHVRKIQQALVQLDFAKIAVDAIYGPKTAAAVATYKKKRKILNFQGKIDDIVGKKTTAALDREMREREDALAKGTPVVLLGFALKPPPVPKATKFRIRRALVASTIFKSEPPFRIYQIVDVKNRLTAFYTMEDRERINTLRFEFLAAKLIDKGAFSDFTLEKPIQVTGFQPEPCREITTKPQEGPSRERIELSMPVVQDFGLTVNMEGLKDQNEGTFTIQTTGILMLIEQSPREVTG